MGSFGVELFVDKEKIEEAIQDADGLPETLRGYVSQITAKANSLSSGYRTGYFYDRSKNQRFGGTQPKYSGDVKRVKRSVVGIIHPKNYAAMKDNHEHNTLLKSV